jgi:hypothetical protein
MRRFASSFSVLLALAAACGSSSQSSNDNDAGDDGAVQVQHEPPCDPGPVAVGKFALGPSTRAVTLKPTHGKLATAPEKNPVDHDALVDYLSQGLADWSTGPGEDDGVVDTLLPGAGASAGVSGRKSIAFVAHLSDFQLADDESTTRVLALDTPTFPGAGRPEEGAVARVASAMHRTLAALTKKRPFDFEIVTGDCADSSQGNEHKWFVQLMDGIPALNTDSGADDDPVPGPDNDVKDPFDPVPAPAPWYFVYGNHDLEIQGTSIADDATKETAIGTHAENGTRDYRLAYAPITRDEVPSDVARISVLSPAVRDLLLASNASPGPVGHGFQPGATSDHYVVDPIAGVPLRLVQLNTTDPDGGSDGQVLQSTVDAFLEPALVQAEKDGKLVILASHQATTDIHTTKGLSSTPAPGALTGAQVEAIVAKHPNVILWLVGHNHLHRIRAIKGPSVGAPGYYEIQTGAIADYPAQSRAVEIVVVPPKTAGDPPTLSVFLTTIDYEATTCLEQRYRAWQLVDMQTTWGQDGSGAPTDRNVELRRAVPAGVVLDGVGKDAIETETTLVGK